MDLEVATSTAGFSSANDNLNIDSTSTRDEDESKAGKQKRYQARRKIEDWAEYRRMRDELGWMDDFDTEFGEVY
jgi:hypothetical protein